ncbi:hypothetical protein, partial [Streptomyces albogriseolus]|uniref:hypothetical protein n=1 Tax=Streptomyces albogriseolus TaxID=1887 RepID=UPI00345F464F
IGQLLNMIYGLLALAIIVAILGVVNTLALSVPLRGDADRVRRVRGRGRRGTSGGRTAIGATASSSTGPADRSPVRPVAGFPAMRPEGRRADAQLVRRPQ